MTSTRFPTKRDRWLAAMIWAGALLATAGGFAQMGSRAPVGIRAVVFLLLVGGAGFMLWIFYATEYVMREQELLIRSGPFRYRVPFSEIESVTPSRDPRSSPAGSLDRLLICRFPGDRGLLVSPEPSLRFLQELSVRCSHLRLDEGRLTRAGAA